MENKRAQRSGKNGFISGVAGPLGATVTER